MTRRPRSAATLALLILAACSGCQASFSTQRWPGPMEPSVEPLGPGARDDFPSGPEQVLIYRHADPVSIARAGEVAGFPMTFYRKVERLSAGSWVSLGAGGRAELLWPADTASVLLYDVCNLVVGEPSRDEPILTFRGLSRARLMLSPGDKVALLGGAILRGDPEEESGPFLLQRIDEELLRLRNQSKKLMWVEYRDQELTLAPGTLVDLPLLPPDIGGTAPEPLGSGMERIDSAGYALTTQGGVDLERRGGAVRVQARGDAEVHALGIRVALLPGQEVLFSDLAALPADRPGRRRGPGAGPRSDLQPGDPEQVQAEGLDADTSGEAGAPEESGAPQDGDG